MSIRARALLLASCIAVIAADQLTKVYIPVLTTTSHTSLAASLVAMSVLVLLSRRYRSLLARVALSFVVAAGVSNLADVVAYGYVRDIFTVYSLVFNVADVGIVIGAAVFMLTMLRPSQTRSV